MFQSPLKTVAEKIKPVESKSSVSSLKFDRESDFKKFINFIKNETKELEKIKLPTTTEVKPKSKRGGVLGLLGLGLFGLLGAGMGGGEKDDKFRIGGTEASGIPTVPQLGLSTLRKTAPRITNKTFKTIKTKKEKQKQRIKVKKIQRDKMRRNRRINAELQRRQQIFAKTFLNEKKIYLDKVRKNMKLPDFVTDADIEQMINEDFGQNLEKYIEDLTKKKLLKKFGFVDPTDPKARRQVAIDINTEDFLNRISKPLTIEEVRVLQDMANQTENIKGGVDKSGVVYPDVEVTQDAEFAREALKDPEVKKIIKEDKFQKITGIDTPEATSFFKGKFTPKYVLDDIFTSIGKNTKGFRDFMSRPFMKGQKPTGLGKALMPAMGFGSKVLRFGGAGLDAAAFVFQAIDLIDGFIVGDNILTAYYDLGVAIHNMFEPDKTKLAFYITKSRDAKKNAFIDKKNQKILEQINKAKAAQSNTSNQVSSASQDAPQGGIIPFAKGMASTAFSELTLSPPIYSLRLITEKLYKQ